MTFVIVAGVLYLMIDGQAVPAEASLWTAFDPLFQRYAKQYGLDWKMLKAIAMNESGLSPAGWIEGSVARGLANPADVAGSKSSDGKSWGLMQVILPTAKDFDSSATAEKLNNPEYAVRIAAQFIAWLTLQFPSSEARYTEWIVKSYNQGRGNTAKERRGEIAGYAGVYWDRYLRNYAKIS